MIKINVSVAKVTKIIKFLLYFYGIMSVKIWHAIGLMSGTSLDGVDLVYVKFWFDNRYHFEILKADTLKYSDSWKNELKSAFIKKPDELHNLSLKYGLFLGELINDFISKNMVVALDFIASHGHTIFHKPEQGITLQIGDGNQIAKLTKHKVVCDFRWQDVQLGGQGAPLVPIGDALLFSNYDYCLNLGGFSNCSFDDKGTRIAYDICPVNIVLNYLTNKLDLDYDDRGSLAKTGIINNVLLNELNALPFYQQLAPKSLGFEFVVNQIFPLLNKYNLPIIDLLRTYTEHIAQQLAQNLRAHKSVLVTGGGAYNQFLIKRFKELSHCELTLPPSDIIEFKEALIFAFLGLLRLENKVNCLKSVTGASKDHSSGTIF